jgi:hypothetical protein
VIQKRHEIRIGCILNSFASSLIVCLCAAILNVDMGYVVSNILKNEGYVSVFSMSNFCHLHFYPVKYALLLHFCILCSGTRLSLCAVVHVRDLMRIVANDFEDAAISHCC